MVYAGLQIRWRTTFVFAVKGDKRSILPARHVSTARIIIVAVIAVAAVIALAFCHPLPHMDTAVFD